MPEDSETGEVDRETVLLVLRHYHVGVADDPENPGCMILIKDEVVESKPIPKLVGKRLLQYFKRRYGVPIHHFYHPDMMSTE